MDVGKEKENEQQKTFQSSKPETPHQKAPLFLKKKTGSAQKGEARPHRCDRKKRPTPRYQVLDRKKKV